MLPSNLISNKIPLLPANSKASSKPIKLYDISLKPLVLLISNISSGVLNQ